MHAKHLTRKNIAAVSGSVPRKNTLLHTLLKERIYELKSVQVVVADNTLTRLLSHISFTFHFVSYTQPVVGNGIKAQSGNPEIKVKGSDPVINQIIDKLKHVIQVSADLLFIGVLNGE